MAAQEFLGGEFLFEILDTQMIYVKWMLWRYSNTDTYVCTLIQIFINILVFVWNEALHKWHLKEFRTNHDWMQYVSLKVYEEFWMHGNSSIFIPIQLNKKNECTCASLRKWNFSWIISWSFHNITYDNITWHGVEWF